MSQLFTLIWLKWRLFRNSMRSSKAVVNRVASILGVVLAITLALIVAIGFGFGAYALTSPEIGFEAFRARNPDRAAEIPSAEFILFSLFALCYLFWAIIPISMGSSRQFEPGHVLLYPISLRRLFAIDLLSEVASLQSIFAIPAILAIGIGAGLGSGNLLRAMLITIIAIAFGVALAKGVSTSVGALLRKKRTRGETLLALIGVVVGVGGALFGQIAPALFRHFDSLPALRFTPPGAIAHALTRGLLRGETAGYVLTLTTLVAYTVVLIILTFWLARRAIMGGGKRKRKRAVAQQPRDENYTGWEVPLVSPELSAILEKELRYISRNAQVRMMALMPFILLIVRLINRRNFSSRDMGGGNSLATDFFTYGEGLILTIGILYSFLILSGLYCNQFAFEHAGMRSLILSPVDRTKVLIGKNLATSLVVLILSVALIVLNHLVFGDVTRGALLFAGLSFLVFAAMLSVMGNWFSVRFPKTMKFGKSSNVSGVVGVLLIPMIGLLTLPPLAAVAAGFVAGSLFVVYVTLGVLAALSIGFYVLIIASQGEALERRELAILEVVKGSDAD